MTTENTPENDLAAESREVSSEQPARPVRRRRKATVAQTAPEKAPAPPAVGAVPAAGQAPVVRTPDQGGDAGAEGASRSTRRRRVTAPQSAPEVAATDGAEPAEEAGADASEEAAASSGEVQEAADAARKGVDDSVQEDADPALSRDEGEDDEVEEVPEGDSSEDDESEADGTDGDEEDDEDDEQGPVLPAASLLFQAPDPTRARRRRRVTASGGVPASAPAPQSSFGAATQDEEEPEARPKRSRRSSRKTSSESVEVAEAVEPTDSQEGAAPAKGRGRRRRKATVETSAPEHVEDLPAEEPDAVQGDGADEQPGSGAPEAVQDTEEAEGARGRGRRRRKSRSVRDSVDQERDDAVPTGDDAEDPSDDPDDEADDADQDSGSGRRKRRRGGRGRRSRSRGEDSSRAGRSSEDADEEPEPTDSSSQEDSSDDLGESSGTRRRRRRTRSRSDSSRDVRDEVTALKGSTRLEAKRQRRREGRAAGRRRPIVTEAEFLARRESVDRQMIVREQDGLNQIAVLEDGLLVEHYVARHTQTSMVGNVYVGRVQNVLPSMEAAFVDLGKGRNAVLYAGEVNWDAAGMEGRPRRIEDALKSGDTVLVQVTKDPIGHKGARLTSQITLAGRYLVLVPGGAMTGISRKLPDTERTRLKKILKRIVPDDAGVIVRTAAEGASEEQLKADVDRLAKQWESIDKKASSVLKGSGKAPVLLKGEPELAVRVVRDVFNEDFRKLVVQGPDAWRTISEYVTELSPDLADRLEHWVSPEDVFTAHRVDEQLAKGFDRKVWLPSGGTLIIDRTEAMTVIDVNTGRFTGAGGTLEETVTRNNIEAAEEIVRQLRLRDIGGMVVIDFVDMVLESNRDLVLRRLVECLGRDRTRHQVTEVTSLGLVQMTRKRVGQGLVEAFSTPCECCGGRGFIVHENPVENQQADGSASASRSSGRGRGKGRDQAAERPGSKRSGKRAGRSEADSAEGPVDEQDDATREAVRRSLAQIAAAAEQAHKEQAEQAQQAGRTEQAGTDGPGEAAETAETVGALAPAEGDAPAAPTEPGTPAEAERAEHPEPAEADRGAEEPEGQAGVADQTDPAGQAAPADPEAGETDSE